MEPIPSGIKFMPAVPFPDPFVPEKRIKQLRQYLDEKHESYQPPAQHANITTVIKSYEEGVIDGTARTFFVNGNIVSEDEAYQGNGHVWIEVKIQMLFALTITDIR